MPESTVSVYEGLVGAKPPAGGHVLFDTACVLGGSIVSGQFGIPTYGQL